MNIRNHATKVDDPAPNPHTASKISVTLPEAQRQQLYQAIVTLVSVLLGIALTMSAQVISQVLLVPDIGTLPNIDYIDPIQSLGTTHITDLVLTEDLQIGDGTPDVTLSGEDAYIEGTLEVDGATRLDGAIDANSTLNLAGAATLADDLTLGNDLTLGGLLYPSFTNLTVTNGSTLTPTYTIYALDSAAAVTMTLAASGTEGQLLLLIGDDANAVTIADTNIRTNDGNAQVLNAYDALLLVYQDDEWLELTESNDS